MSYLKDIVNDYIQEYRHDAEDELAEFSGQKSISDAITQAAMCQEPSGKRHSHQCRIPTYSLKEAKKILLRNSKKIEKCSTFEQLHHLINTKTEEIWGIGELTVYDIATRIGAFLGVYPTTVYLHRGTREGAQALGFSGAKPFLEISQLPAEFSALKAYEIEDCLCIYKDALKNGRFASGKGCHQKPKRQKRGC